MLQLQDGMLRVALSTHESYKSHKVFITHFGIVKIKLLLIDAVRFKLDPEYINQNPVFCTTIDSES